MKITFTGDFKKLIPMGYKFSKVWANNYICYSKDGVQVWRAGRDVEINDLYGSGSHLVLQYLVDNNFTVLDRFCRIVWDNVNNIIVDHDFDKHESVAWHLQGKTESEIRSLRNQFRVFMLTQDTINALQELYNLGMIHIANEEEKKC